MGTFRCGPFHLVPQLRLSILTLILFGSWRQEPLRCASRTLISGLAQPVADSQKGMSPIPAPRNIRISVSLPGRIWTYPLCQWTSSAHRACPTIAGPATEKSGVWATL